LDGVDGQRRRGRLSGGALPRVELHELRSSGDAIGLTTQRLQVLTASTTYRYRIRCIGCGRTPWCLLERRECDDAVGRRMGDTQAPTVTHQPQCHGGIELADHLSWTASTDNVAVTGYEVQRCTGTSCTPGGSFGTPSGTTFNDTGLSPSTNVSLCRARARCRYRTGVSLPSIASADDASSGRYNPTDGTDGAAGRRRLEQRDRSRHGRPRVTMWASRPTSSNGAPPRVRPTRRPAP